MLIRVKETQKEFAVSLCEWKDGQWQPDCFYDFEVNVPKDYPKVEGSDAYEMPQKDFDGMVDYWKSECSDFNEGRWSEQFGDREEADDDVEIDLFVDEM